MRVETVQEGWGGIKTEENKVILYVQIIYVCIDCKGMFWKLIGRRQHKNTFLSLEEVTNDGKE